MASTRVGLTALVVAGLVAAVVVVVSGWLRPDIRWDDVADAPNHLVRIYVIDAALARGDWYPRWLSDLYLGYGYPLLSFYAPATYYVAVLLHRWGMTVYASFQWTAVLSVAFGAAGAAALAFALTARRDAALLAGSAFVLAPYPFLTNLYVRAAVPEALALGLLPWLLLALWACWRGGGMRSGGLALGIAALLLTHNISALMGVGVLALWLPVVALLAGVPALPALRRTLCSLAAGLGLSAFFWLPALAETSFVQIRLAQADFFDVQHWLFDPLRATGKLAEAGYPHSRVGPVDLGSVFDYGALPFGAPEKITLWQLLLWCFAALAASAALLAARRTRRRVPGPTTWRAGRPAALASVALFWAAVAFACLLLNTSWSSAFWTYAPLAANTQFPWRTYGPLALAGALAAAFALAALPPRSRGLWPARICAAALVLLLAHGSLAALAIPFGAEPAHDVDERDVAALEYDRYGAGTTSGGEFLPLTVHWEEDQWPGRRRGVKLYETSYPQAGWQAGLVRVIDGDATVTGVYQQPNRVIADVEATAPSRLGIHQLVFPGWRAFVDGRPASIAPATIDTPIPASLGFIVVDVPPGTHQVEVRFGATLVRTIASALSVATAALGVAWLLWGVSARMRATASRRLPAAWAAATLALAAAACSVAGQTWTSRPGARLTAEASRIVLDVAGAVTAGRAQTSSPAGSGNSVFPSFLEVRRQTIAGEGRRWLYMHPPSSLSVVLRVPADAYFQAGLALDPDTWTTPTGDGVRFIVEAQTSTGTTTLLDRHVNPRARGEDRAWVDTWVSLDPVAGQDVRLILRTDAAADPTFDWAGWANPQVVIWRAARPQPGAEHEW